MDYKEKVELIEWHVKFTDLNGTNAKVLFLLISKANYKTNEINISFDDIAKTIRTSKVSVSKSISSLIENNAITISDKNSGKMASTYKISDMEKLNFLFRKEKINPEYIKWVTEKDNLFFDISRESFKLFKAIDECEECKSGEYANNLCYAHLIKKSNMENNIEYRKYQLWMMDNPKPKNNIYTIKDIEVS